MRAFELIITVVVGFNALATLVGIGARRVQRRRRLTHDEYQARLRADNEELDRHKEELDRQLDEMRRNR